MRFIGRREGISEELTGRMDWAEAQTEANDRITLFVAFNYGGRAEILDAAAAYQGGGEEEFQSHLYAPEMHDPDLLIRTSGEQRISNYLLWQCAYSEFVFRDELWPDFSREAFEACARRVRGAPAALRGEGADDRGSRPALVRVRSRREERDRPRERAPAAGRSPRTSLLELDEPVEADGPDDARRRGAVAASSG